MYNSLKFLSSHKQMVDWQNAHLFLAHKNFATKYLISGVSRLHSIKTRFHLKHVDISCSIRRIILSLSNIYL